MVQRCSLAVGLICAVTFAIGRQLSSHLPTPYRRSTHSYAAEACVLLLDQNWNLRSPGINEGAFCNSGLPADSLNHHHISAHSPSRKGKPLAVA